MMPRPPYTMRARKADALFDVIADETSPDAGAIVAEAMDRIGAVAAVHAINHTLVQRRFAAWQALTQRVAEIDAEISKEPAP